jgi:hypothetical protein
VVRFVITVVEKGLERARDFLSSIPRAAEQAVARALNKAAEEARDEAVAAIMDRYAARAGDVREKISLKSATPDHLVVTVMARSGALALGYFPHGPTAAGTGGRGRPILRAEVLRGQEREVGNAFIAPINGKPRIMIRTGGRTKTGKTAIRSLSAVPIASMLGAASVRAAVEARAFAVFDHHLDREIDRALGRASA